MTDTSPASERKFLPARSKTKTTAEGRKPQLQFARVKSPLPQQMSSVRQQTLLACRQCGREVQNLSCSELILTKQRTVRGGRN